MPSRKTVSNKSDRLVFAETLEKFGNSIEKLLEQVNIFEQFKREKLMDFELLRETKNQDIMDLEKQYNIMKVELEKEYEVLTKNKEIECKQYIQEYRLKAITEYLSERNEVSISIEELDTLRLEITKLNEQLSNVVETTTSQLESKHKQALNAVITNNDLKHKAETAFLSASAEQKDNEIKSLHATIANLKAEISAQRELTNSIAQSMKQAPITQTFTK